MDSVIELDPDVEQLTLYFQLKPETLADLETSAEVSIAWSRALKAAAAALDPEGELIVEIIDADEGSLNVNAALRWVRVHLDPTAARIERSSQRMPKTFRMALALAGFLIFDVGTAVLTYFPADEWSDEERAEIHKQIQRIHDDNQFRERKRELFKAAERDPKVRALGVKETPRGPALAIVEGQHFAEASGLFAEQEADLPERTTSTIVEVVLVKPALVAQPRAWTFEQVGLGQFDAIMADAKVIAAMRDKGLPERLREGIPMRLRLEVHEVAYNGEWRVARRGRVITKVLSPSLD